MTDSIVQLKGTTPSVAALAWNLAPPGQGAMRAAFQANGFEGTLGAHAQHLVYAELRSPAVEVGGWQGRIVWSGAAAVAAMALFCKGPVTVEIASIAATSAPAPNLDWTIRRALLEMVATIDRGHHAARLACVFEPKSPIGAVVSAYEAEGAPTRRSGPVARSGAV